MSIRFYDDHGVSDPENATSVTVSDVHRTMNPSTLILPTKKLVNTKWILCKIGVRVKKSKTATNIKNIVGDLLDVICKRFNVHYIETIYPTKYGFGVKVANNKQHQKVRAEIISFLEKYQIEFDIEISNSHSISQYKLNQSKSNINKFLLAVKKY